MERILLVEPDYSNKYPPLGLMKIATYHKCKGDRVEFYKGKAPYTVISKSDRVYITSLFTFYYDITISTIKHYLDYIDSDSIYVGGIAATLMYDSFKIDTGINNIITGQLTNSSFIGYSDNVNIDELPLDYDILDDIPYRYPAGDNFFVYTTRGCSRGCEFCAVPKLEPKFIETNHIRDQITAIRERYGDKRNVLIMDNNILYSKNLHKIADDLKSLQFNRNNLSYIYPNPLESIISKIERRKNSGNNYLKQVDELLEFLLNFKNRIKANPALDLYNAMLDQIYNSTDKYSAVIAAKDELVKLVEKHRFKRPLQRYVDFNQGIDARLLTDEKMKLFEDIAIKPFRLAYDSLDETPAYTKAFNIAYKYGVRYFSNYILYNYNDSPEDLWFRLHNSILLFQDKSDLQAFSFPMKYAPIQASREYINNNWNKKFLSAINVILNVTKGVVAKEIDFFYKAYGKNPDEFKTILSMPTEFIKYRLFFEKYGFINEWMRQYHNLNEVERSMLIRTLSKDYTSDNSPSITLKLQSILKFYHITKYNATQTLQNNTVPPLIQDTESPGRHLSVL